MAAVVTSLGDLIGGIGDAVGGVASGIREGISFAADPLGYIFEKLQQSANGWYEVIIPALVRAAKPDLTLEWFLGAYSISFGIAMFGWVFLLLFQMAMAGRPGRSRFDLIDSLTEKSGLFLIGAAYGPALGWVVVHFFHTLSEFFLSWWGTSTEDALRALQDLISGDDWLSLPGGLVMGILLMFAMLIAAVLVVLMLVLALVAIYMTGVVFPLAWMWVVGDPSRRTISARFAWMWFGLNAAHPLMFFLLGVSFQMIASSIAILDAPALSTVINALAACVTMVICALAPGLLFKFAPVMPTSAGQQTPGLGGGGGRGRSMPSSPSNTEAVANDQAEADGDGTDGGDGDGAGSGKANGGDGQAEQGPLEKAASEEQGAPGEQEPEEKNGVGSAEDGAGETTADSDDPAGDRTASEGAGGPDSTSALGGGESEPGSTQGAASTQAADEGAQEAAGADAAGSGGVAAGGGGAAAGAGPAGLALVAATDGLVKARDGLQSVAQMAAAEADDDGGPR